MTCCSASAKAPTALSWAGPRAAAGKPPTCTAQLLAAEPHATAERKRELRTEAVRRARQSPLCFDLTISLSKSISIFHASLGENARLARQVSDHDGDAYWSALVGEVDEMIWQAKGAKVILAGDVSQLQAVENGGGMSLLAARLGYAQLAEPVRFRHAWEQAASLRLRDGDASVLAEYDQHGRIIGGGPEQTMDAAAAAYVALTAGGTDTLLMAADHALRRELNRRIRDDLITLGIVPEATDPG
jgi:hypothetical protein